MPGTATAAAMDLTLTEWVSRWLPTLGARVAPETAQAYARDVQVHCLPTLGLQSLTVLRRVDIREALEGLLGAGLSPSHVRNCWIALAACLEAAVERGLLPANPAHGAARKLFRRPARGYAKGKGLTEPQLMIFLAAIATVAPAFVDLFVTLAETSARLGEVLALEPRHVDDTRPAVWIGQKWLNGRLETWVKGNQPRWLEITPALAARLLERTARQPGCRWLFPGQDPAKPWTRWTVARAMARVCRAASLPPHFRPHALRHTRATLLLETTGDCLYVSRTLGHSGISVTCDLYGSGAEPRRPDALAALEARLHARLPPLAVPPTPPAVRAGS